MAQKDRILVKECVEYIENNNKSNELYQEFYKNLFNIEPKLKVILSENESVLKRKFFNMLATFKAIKYIDKISDEFISMGVRHKSYGMNEHYLNIMGVVLIESLSSCLGEKFSEYKEAWKEVYSEISDLFIQALKSDKTKVVKGRVKNLKPNFIDEIGGVDVIKRINKKFYDLIFEDKWLGEFFAGKDKESLTIRQTQFMAMSFGGESNYKGETPSLAHMHMYLTEEMITIREQILKKVILEDGVKQELCDKWIEIDHYYGSFLIKNSVDDCVLKCRGQGALVAKKPENYSSDMYLV